MGDDFFTHLEIDHSIEISTHYPWNKKILDG